MQKNPKLCPNCHQPTMVMKTVLRQHKLLIGCDSCLTNLLQGGAAKYERDWQRGEYRKSIIQPNQPQDFVRAYGADVAREHGYTDEQVRRYS